MKNTSLLLILVLLSACTQKRDSNLSYGKLQGRFQETIDSIYTANPDIKGIMVHVESPSYDISWSGASGYSDYHKKQILKADQPALIASCIKTYVTATILRLVEMGKIQLEQPVKCLLTENTRKLFQDDGYQLDSIKVYQLMSHTSGIKDYANDSYIEYITKNPEHRWTRNEQLQRTVNVGEPLGKPGAVFSYADANYLLLTEIIEGLCDKPFYLIMRELLRYKELGLDDTWFPTLEETPRKVKPLVHQYWGRYDWDSYKIDISWDLYGGGGIACNTEDLAKFSYNLFNSAIVKDTAVLKLFFKEISTQDSLPNQYHLGLSEDQYSGIEGYGHGGFWGTVVMYFPKLEASIAVYVLEKDKEFLTRDILEQMVKLMNDMH